MKIVDPVALRHFGSRLLRDLPSLVPDLEIIAIDNMLAQRYAALSDLPPKACRRFVEVDASADKQEEVERVNHNDFQNEVVDEDCSEEALKPQSPMPRPNRARRLCWQSSAKARALGSSSGGWAPLAAALPACDCIQR